jgi:hypothetical protein
MSTRTLAVVFCSLSFLVACGGDEEEPSSAGACVGSELSVPDSENDPCPQTDAMCVAAGGKAYATCVEGKWADSCQCVVAGGQQTPMTPPPVMEQATCGDGKITAPREACDGQNLNGASCQSLGFMGGGQLLCNPSTCNYDMIMCRMTSGRPMGGTSGGAGMSGGAGSGS